MAQSGGIGEGDPLTLAASGMLVPFYNGASGDISFLEAVSPITQTFTNALVNPQGHLIFFNANCTRGDSRPLPLTANDVDIRDTRNGAPNQNGLIAIATTPNGNDLIPLLGAIINPGAPSTFLYSYNTGLHTRLFWINATTGKSRIVEPITLALTEDILEIKTTWNPLRTAANFFTLPQGGAISTTINLICPKTTIQGTATSVFGDLTGFVSSTSAGVGVVGLPAFGGGVLGAPPAFPVSIPTFQSAYPSGSIRGRVYDLDEHIIGDINSDCDCNILKSVTALSVAYTDFTTVPHNASAGTYTELEAAGLSVQTNFPFTGYRAIDIAGTFFATWNRLSNASRATLRNDTFVTTTATPSTNTTNLR
jgi:hypothetical protein